MELQRKDIGDTADIVPSSSLILHESTIVPPTPVISIHQKESEIQLGDRVNFGNDIFIMTRRPDSGETVLYEATKEFKDFLQKSSTKSNDPPKEICHILSDTDTKGLWRKSSIPLKRILISVICVAIVSGIVALCNTFVVQDKSEWWYVYRDTWNPRERKCPMADLKLPVKLVVLSHTGGVFCNTNNHCLAKVRDEQANGIDKNLCDVKYSFLIGGDTRVYEGRLFKQRENFTDKYYDKSLMIGFIGNYNVDIPSPAMFDHLLMLFNISVSKQHFTPDFRITAGDLIGSDGPGSHIQSIVSKWDRWTEKPEDVFPP